MPIKKKVVITDPNQNVNTTEKEYQYAISLMQYATELLWHQFSVFMLTETIIVGYLGNILIRNNKLVLGENLFVFVGSVFGLFICILWYSTFKHNHKAYILRMNQAKRHEKVLGIRLFTEGEKEYNESKIPRWFRPYSALKFLIFSFGILFALLIVVTRPYQ